MIDEYWTWIFYGYHSDELSHGSNKPIVVRCDECCQYRVVINKNYRDLCASCAKMGERHPFFGKKRPPFTEEHRRNLSISLNGREGIPHTEEWKHERSIAMMGENNPMYGKRGEETGMYGEHHNEASKHKISVANTGKHHNEASKHKMSVSRTGVKNPMYGRRGEDSPLFGRHHSEETKQKMSEAGIGRVFSDEHRNNMSLARIGKSLPPFTDDHKQKISIANTGYRRSEEHRQRQSARQQGIAYDEWEAFACEKKYCPKYDDACRESNREKYSRRCFICGLPESENVDKSGKQKKLSVHHVDMNKNQGCDGIKWKLIPVCLHHHLHSDLWKDRIVYLLEHVWNTY